MKKFQWILYSVCSIALLLFVSCNKLLDTGVSDNRLDNKKIFTNDSLSREAVVGICVSMMSAQRNIFNGGTTLLASLSADELTDNKGDGQEYAFYRNSLEPDIRILRDSLWLPAYNYIYQCNNVIERLYEYDGVSQLLKNQLIGEVKFLRAFCYYYLVNLFGDMPLVLVTDYKQSAIIPRTPVSKIYQQIIEDLQQADSLLPNNISNAFPTKLASEAMLSRVYLHQQKWEEAEAYATLVIQSGKFSLENDLDKVFVSTSRETIFQLETTINGINTVEGRLFIPFSATATPSFSMDSTLVDAFQANDSRKAHWTKTINVYGISYTIPYKYKLNSDKSSVREYNVVLRLAEQYLIRAEARTMQLKLQEAVEDLNIIRNRAALPLLPPSLSLDECGNAIEQERRIELFTEWGHRWFDLKRTSRANAILGARKGSDWQSTDQLYPVPTIEMTRNPSLTQNSGY